MGFIIILIVGALIWYFGFYKKKQANNTLASSSIETNAEPVLQEALGVINDFLNVGTVAQIFHGDTDFRGFINFTRDARPPFQGKYINYGFVIILEAVDDMSISAAKYPKMLTNNPDFADKYYAFMRKYQNCFDPEKKAYVYITTNTVPLLKGQDTQLTQLLRERVANECPLADFSGSLLYTKNVAR
jgi:hypothetical protein